MPKGPGLLLMVAGAPGATGVGEKYGGVARAGAYPSPQNFTNQADLTQKVIIQSEPQGVTQ